MRFASLGRLLGVVVVAAIVGGATQAQVTYSWNNGGTDPSLAAAWNPAGGPPTATDIAQFTPGGSAFGSTVQNPIFGGAFNALSLTTGLNPNAGGWNLTGAGSITLGGTGSTGITTFGPQTTTVNGPTLAGASPTSLLAFNVTSGSVLVLTGTTAVTANQGNIVVAAGTFRLDNSATNNNTRLLNTGVVTVNGGGTFELIGNAAGTTQTVGTLNTGSNVIGGLNTFRINNNGGLTTLTFANAAAGFASRPGTRGTYRFEAASGTLGALASDASGSRINFVGTPFVGANGLISNSAGGGTFGYATVKDSDGTNFATYTTARGLISAANTNSGLTVITVTDAATAATLTATSIGQLNQNVVANPTITLAAALTSGSLRITPSAAGGTLALGASNLVTNALMIDGVNNYTVASTGNLGGAGTRYVYVNDPNNIFFTNLIVANGANPTTFAGLGFVELTGTATQNTLTLTNRFVVAGGTVRGNTTQIGFVAGGVGVISLTGGVLEIKGGANGTGTSADFTRALGAAAGNVTLGGNTANEVGSGGFSAFGSNASVNIGGVATPSTLQWNQTDFVGTGYALTFGSTKSNAVLTFLNPLNLENGTAYQSREVKVTRGVGGDKTVFAGVISGATGIADFVKTGNGLLELNQPNTYTGKTFVTAGTLSLTNASGSGTGTGAVNVAVGATLAGTGTVTPGTGNTVNIAAGGTIRGGDPSLTTGLGTLTVNRITIRDGGTIYVRIPTAGPVGAFSNGASSAGTLNAPANNNYVRVTDVNGLTTDPTAINYLLDGAGSTFVFGQSYSYVIGRNDGTALGAGTGTVLTNDPARFTFNNFNIAPDPTTISLSGDAAGYIYVNFTPVPEPTTIVGLGAALLAVGGTVRRRRRSLTKA